MRALSRLLPFFPPLLLAGTPAPAAVPESLLALDISELVNIPVVTASRREQALWQAPAVVVVLDGEDLRRRGVRSLAEALASVPGFHVMDDGVGHSVVVRGVGAGQRAYGRTLKLMLDGQPLGLRSDATQFLGPELLPMALVERIEIVRGPASALYGADAYLGVINIITRQDGVSGLKLAAGHETGSGHAGAGELLLAGTLAGWQGVLAAGAARQDRSGRELPRRSPLAPLPDDRAAADIARPQSLYARLQHAQADTRHALVFHAAERDSHGEFLDFGVLSHRNRLAVTQQTVGWQSEWRAGPQLSRGRLAHAWGGVADDERLSLGLAGSRPERDFGYRATELGLEHQRQLGRHHLVAGVDGSWNHEQPFAVYSINELTGDRVRLSPDQPERLFRNLGAYLQSQWQPLPDSDWMLALNWRHDRHNRYGGRDSWRAGLTGPLADSLTAKLLYGTAFKAPAAAQLYGQPLYTGDALGNPGLRPETARTLEGQLAWQADEQLLFTLTLYRLEVEQLIELQPFGISQRWDNRGEQRGEGAAFEARWQPGRHQLGLTTSWHDMRLYREAPLVPTVDVPTAAAPRLMATADWRWRESAREVGLAARHVSSRRASDSNIERNFDTVYTLPSYTLLRLHALHEWGAHRLTLSIDNLLDERYAEPGHGGVDVPGAGRQLWLAWSWQR